MIFEGTDTSTRKMRNDIKVDFTTMGESVELDTNEGLLTGAMVPLLNPLLYPKQH